MHGAGARRNFARNVWLVASCETVAKRNFRFSKHTVYDDIKSARAQPVHKVKQTGMKGEPAGNVCLKGCLVRVEAARVAVGVDRTIVTYFAFTALVKHKKTKERKKRIIYLAL